MVLGYRSLTSTRCMRSCYLDEAIDAHRRGFECDWRSASSLLEAVGVPQATGNRT
jgi:hypothetical protein